MKLVVDSDSARDLLVTIQDIDIAPKDQWYFENECDDATRYFYNFDTSTFFRMEVTSAL